LCRQVAHMAERGKHLVATAQIGINSLCLRGRFNNDYLHVFPLILHDLTRRYAESQRGARRIGKMGKAPAAVKPLRAQYEGTVDFRQPLPSAAALTKIQFYIEYMS